MKLINTTTLDIEEFFGTITVPPYAILSHTWEDEEVSYQDFVLRRRIAESKKGFSKIKRTCQEARDAGIEYAWVDTCCIDKTSSAELTEAINSMFQWYASAVVCYAFLSDLVSNGNNGQSAIPEHSDLARCRWFTRGWTLQELIAPQSVIFYDGNWKCRGTKAELSEAISAVTGIDHGILLDCSLLSTVPVARRMSWASRRQTTRLEDTAYSLLGIFDVNMPMLYGEGGKAFIRLQEEIAKQTNDLTLFAWQSKEYTPSERAVGHDAVDQSLQATQRFRGILATEPSEFAAMSDIEAVDETRFNAEFAMTNKGLRIAAKLYRVPNSDNYAISLQGSRQEEPDKAIGILLKRHGAAVFARDQPHKLFVLPNEIEGVPAPIYISKTLTPALSAMIACEHRHAIRFRRGFNDNEYFTCVNTMPRDLWDAQRQLFLTRGLPSFTGMIHFISKNPIKYKMPSGGLLVVFGIKPSGPWASFVEFTDRGVKEAMKSSRMGDFAKLVGDERRLTCTMDCRAIDRVPFKSEATYQLKLSIEESELDNEPIYYIDIDVDKDIVTE